VIDRPLATIVTPISIDHTDFLGDTLEKIATEKAGIFKPGVPALVAAQSREVLAVLERQAARLKAPMKIAGEDWTATEERGRLVFQDEAGLLDLPAPKLYGRHQFENAGLAVAALRAAAPFKISPAAFEQGMVKAEWPARMQRLAHGRLLELIPAGSELWLDGVIHCCSFCFGAAPTWREAISPPLKIIRVGIDITPYFEPSSGSRRRSA
jgi:dihydrofolate synthase/folylpolyglutamate synthase